MFKVLIFISVILFAQMSVAKADTQALWLMKNDQLSRFSDDTGAQETIPTVFQNSHEFQFNANADTAWVLHPPFLSHVTIEGEVEWQVKDVHLSDSDHFVVSNASRAVWLTRGSTLLKVSFSGDVLRSFHLPHKISSIVMDTLLDQVIVTSGQQVLTIDQNDKQNLLFENEVVANLFALVFSQGTLVIQHRGGLSQYSKQGVKLNGYASNKAGLLSSHQGTVWFTSGSQLLKFTQNWSKPEKFFWDELIQNVVITDSHIWLLGRFSLHQVSLQWQLIKSYPVANESGQAKLAIISKKSGLSTSPDTAEATTMLVDDKTVGLTISASVPPKQTGTRPAGDYPEINLNFESQSGSTYQLNLVTPKGKNWSVKNIPSSINRIKLGVVPSGAQEVNAFERVLQPGSYAVIAVSDDKSSGIGAYAWTVPIEDADKQPQWALPGLENSTLERLTTSVQVMKLQTNETRSLNVYAHYTDGKRVEVTHLVTWQSDNAAVADVKRLGIFAGLAPGKAELIADYSGQKTQVSVFVEPVESNTPENCYQPSEQLFNFSGGLEKFKWKYYGPFHSSSEPFYASIESNHYTSIYVSKGQKPSLFNYDCRTKYFEESSECQVDLGAGDYYLAVRNVSKFAASYTLNIQSTNNIFNPAIDDVGSCGIPEVARINQYVTETSAQIESLKIEKRYWNMPSYLGLHYVTQYYVILKWLGIFEQSQLDESYLKQLLLESQRSDGSWNAVKQDINEPFGEMDATIFNYFALKVMGVDVQSTPMLRAKNFIVSRGGIGEATVLTKIWLAHFGNAEWEAIPYIPMIFLMDWSPLNYTDFSSWTQPNIIPITYLRRHRMVKQMGEQYQLDELWIGAPKVTIKDGVPLHRWQANLFVNKLAAFQQPKGSIGAYALSSLMALIVLDDIQARYPQLADKISPVTEGALSFLESIFLNSGSSAYLGVVDDGRYWDTALLSIALIGAGAPLENFVQTGEYLIQQQNDNGGFPFGEDFWFVPDNDDTAEIMMLLSQLDVDQGAVDKALGFLYDMQNKDGGWAAFDKNNTGNPIIKLIASALLDSVDLYDNTSNDVTGHVLEAMSHLGLDKHNSDSVKKGIQYLKNAQKSDIPVWLGKWGTNYLYGTSAALVGLLKAGENHHETYIKSSLRWLESRQNSDGGFGENNQSYHSLNSSHKCMTG
ncbi:MAG: hypothetical protein HN790_13500 [Methylococcales bacterium]|nr:hypothetical protein [Methylococcales bacterium]